jgi:hypothetical protein
MPGLDHLLTRPPAPLDGASANLGRIVAVSLAQLGELVVDLRVALQVRLEERVVAVSRKPRAAGLHVDQAGERRVRQPT